jgi:YD repeat-containing protein
MIVPKLNPTSPTAAWTFPPRRRRLISLGLALLGPSVAAAADLTPTPVQPNSYELMTNIVVVTNYVLTTNIVFRTNAFTASSSNSALPDLSWVPPIDRFDWIQLKSGEWLKGQLKAMQEDELEFESEELDYLTFDWKDIRQVRSPRTFDTLSVTGEEVTGSVTITPDQVMVGGPAPWVIPRAQLQSLTPGGSKERNFWSGNLSVGLTLRAGNTEQVEYNAQARLQRRTPATRLSLDYIGNISSVESVESARNHRVNSEFDMWLSRRFYLIVPFVEYYQDPFQNLAHRYTVGLGVGYDLIARPKLEWNITAGPAYQKVWFESAQPGEPTEKTASALTFSSRFDWEINQRADLILEYRGQYTSQEVGETTHHAVATVSLDLTKRFDLDVSLTWDRISQPKAGADGIEPQPDDFRLVVGLGVDF